MAQSKELTAFYRTYVRWVNAGAPQGRPFSRTDGLCIAIRRYTDSVSMRTELRKQLIIAFGDWKTPFNPAGDFATESNSYTCHMNPARIRWAREHAI